MQRDVIGKVGRLRTRYGPMFAGKSVWLRVSLSEAAAIGFNCLYVGHRTDDREDGAMSSHSKVVTRDKISGIDEVKVSRLSEIDATKYDMIGIDECQFFDLDDHRDFMDVVEKWVEKNRKNVDCAGLDYDFARKPFGRWLDINGIADEGKKITALCQVCKDLDGSMVFAPFTRRTVDVREQVLTGKGEFYQAVCRRHYTCPGE